jgi:hypothetical protein
MLRNNCKYNSLDIYDENIYLRGKEKNYKSSFILVNTVANPDPAISKESLYQDHKCLLLLTETSDLAKKLANNLIFKGNKIDSPAILITQICNTITKKERKVR